jgi:hypothetical protein
MRLLDEAARCGLLQSENDSFRILSHIPTPAAATVATDPINNVVKMASLLNFAHEIMETMASVEIEPAQRKKELTMSKSCPLRKDG